MWMIKCLKMTWFCPTAQSLSEEECGVLFFNFYEQLLLCFSVSTKKFLYFLPLLFLLSDISSPSSSFFLPLLLLLHFILLLSRQWQLLLLSLLWLLTRFFLWLNASQIWIDGLLGNGCIQDGDKTQQALQDCLSVCLSFNSYLLWKMTGPWRK